MPGAADVFPRWRVGAWARGALQSAGGGALGTRVGAACGCGTLAHPLLPMSRTLESQLVFSCFPLNSQVN